ncbi:hypothetical protein PAXINDRAFT_180864 [Paxillus involutus ATCC 200175]|uniref:Transmembrane protein n=1 Tax=Paxillus involutus ATCC 200175 TaxID=664439 RepID=A0A0C9SY67_PAXIN|nr:hypothetical protein PAXINDRAFT_180864 [Paxillus involutus ATCC 200175]
MATNCSSWSWIQNQEGLSPCQTAQLVGQVCNSQYTVSTSNFQETQFIPNTTTANACTCSWASYNLVSACTVCLVQEQLASWKTWTTSCGSYVSTTTYLPSVLPASEGIPYFAGTDPGTWTDEIFNVTEAAGKGGGAQADLTGAPSSTPTTSSSSSKLSVGAIIGGVLGGIVVILVLVGLVFFIRALRRRQAFKGPFDGLATTTINGAHFFSVPTAPPQAPTGLAFRDRETTVYAGWRSRARFPSRGVWAHFKADCDRFLLDWVKMLGKRERHDNQHGEVAQGGLSTFTAILIIQPRKSLWVQLGPLAVWDVRQLRLISNTGSGGLEDPATGHRFLWFASFHTSDKPSYQNQPEFVKNLSLKTVLSSWQSCALWAQRPRSSPEAGYKLPAFVSPSAASTSYTMVFSGLLSLVVVVPWLSGSSAMVVHPNIFAPTSPVVCQNGYAWMNNEEGNNPCLAVAYVIAACLGHNLPYPLDTPTIRQMEQQPLLVTALGPVIIL